MRSRLMGLVVATRTGRRGGLAALLVIAATSAGSLATAAVLAPSATAAGESGTVYVTNQAEGTVTPIDESSGATGTAIPVGASPVGIAVTPDGKNAYVDHYLQSATGNTLTPVGIPSNVAGTPIDYAGGESGVVAITPDGQTAYVANEGFGKVTAINLATATGGAEIGAFEDPSGLAVTPNGKTVYVINGSDNQVDTIDTSTNTKATTLTLDSDLTTDAVAMSPDGQTVYVAVTDHSDATQDAVIPVATATNTAGTPIPVAGIGRNATQMVISPNGKTLYLTVASVLPDGDVVSLIALDIATGTVGAAVPLDVGLSGLAITPDGARVYVANSQDGTVTPIDTATNTAGAAIAVDDPTAIALTPNHAPVCSALSLTTAQNTTGSVAPSCTDADGDTLSYKVVAQGTKGSASVVGGNLQYVPNAGATGPDSFTYTANDGHTDGNGAAVSVTITPAVVNHAPVCAARSLTTAQNTTGSVAPSCTDADGDTLSYKVVAQGTKGSASVVGGNLQYVPRTGASGSDSFTYTANDGHTDGNAATVSVTIAQRADLSVALSAAPTQGRVGGLVVYAITVHNNGPATATSVKLVDQLSPFTTPLTTVAAPAGVTCVTTSSAVTCNASTMASGNAFVVLVLVRINHTGQLANTATVTAATPDSVPANNSKTVMTTAH